MARCLCSLLAVVVGFFLSATTVGADPEKDIIGTWEGTSGAGGFKEIWTIERDKDGWSVRGVFKKGDDEVGAWVGKDPKFANGVLTCVQQYSKKPNPGWTEGNVLQAKATGDKLTFVWRAGKNSGTVSLVRAGEARTEVKPKDDVATKPKDTKTDPNPKDAKDPVTIKPKDNTKTEPKTEPKVSKEMALVGTWEADVDNVPDMKEIWKIEVEDGKWSVKGVYVLKKVTVGAFHAEKIQLVGEALNFTQKYDVKPVPNWSDGNVVFVKPGDGKIEFSIGKKGAKHVMVKSDATLSAVVEPKKKEDPNKVELTEEAKKELGTLAGTWNLKSITFNGMDVSFNTYWTIGEGTIVEHLEAKGTMVRRSGTVNVDVDKSPKVIEINYNKGNGAPTAKWRGIYELKDGVLTMCVSGLDDPMPTDFTSKPNSKALLIVLRPAKK
jgi:uncharacterized protein (TIGR03067 family)